MSNIVPFRPAPLGPELVAAAEAAAMALRTFKPSPELDCAIERLRTEIEGDCWRHELLARSTADARLAFLAGLAGRSAPPGVVWDQRAAFLRGVSLRARLAVQPTVQMQRRRGLPWPR